MQIKCNIDPRAYPFRALLNIKEMARLKIGAGSAVMISKADSSSVFVAWPSAAVSLPTDIMLSASAMRNGNFASGDQVEMVLVDVEAMNEVVRVGLSLPEDLDLKMMDDALLITVKQTLLAYRYVSLNQKIEVKYGLKVLQLMIDHLDGVLTLGQVTKQTNVVITNVSQPAAQRRIAVERLQGLDSQIEQLKILITKPLTHPEI